jgi:Protein tyrosine and serine/threonine kinase
MQKATETKMATKDSDLDDDDISEYEVNFLRHFMSTHTMRGGIARYAIKRARSDLKSNELEGAVVDLAIEAKFLSTMCHPNIVRMRGTVGTPGTEGFMIIMDRLQITLREKMVLWNSEAKRRNSGLVDKLFGRTSNASIQREQYAEKLLAAYDIARAMRYLHNHM